MTPAAGAGDAMETDDRRYTMDMQQYAQMRAMMRNPSDAMRQMMARQTEQLMQAQMEEWRAQDPARFDECMGQLRGLSHDQLVRKVNGIARRHGVDLLQLAGQYGIELR